MVRNFIFAHTPEALLGRNDSRNPATTCKGITTSGRACRRPLTAPAGTRQSTAGVASSIGHDEYVPETILYCWQHKDQAAKNSTVNDPGLDKRTTQELKGRSSIDTLVKRLGIRDDTNQKEESKRDGREKTRPPRRTDTRDFAVRDTANGEKHSGYVRSPQPRQSRPNRPGFWASLCCITDDDYDERIEIVRHRKRVERQRQAVQQRQSLGPHQEVDNPAPPQVASIHPQPLTRAASNPQTAQLMSLIPAQLPPTTASNLLSELIKPVSPYDEEGYIYIFWLTPQSKATPPESTARSLLSPPDSRPQHARRVSDVMTEYSYSESDDPSARSRARKKQRNTVMLKIGRANNVTRRMNEWQRQCGYSLNLIRWYPYVPLSTTPSPRPSPQKEVVYPDLSRPPPAQRRESEMVRKVPCVKRVERLIHIELAEKQVRQQCETCGKEHREWFEVEASQSGVRGVDEVVRRWVGWAEGIITDHR